MKKIKRCKAPILIAVVFMGLALWLPDTAERSATVLWNYFKEMALILPPVFILMGLMEVWIPKDKIQKWLGTGSGIKGAGIAFILGTLPTGPLYIAFPMTATLIRKGASIMNMVIFLGSWAALKIPQLMVEVKFLGIPFTLLRFSLTLFALVLIGLLMEFLLRRFPDEHWLKRSEETKEQTKQQMHFPDKGERCM